jgi:succinyl-CoA synthetase alpha subunit
MALIVCKPTSREILKKPGGLVWERHLAAIETDKETDMTRQLTCDAYDDCFEYHGSTVIEHTRTQAGVTVWRDWIIFDSVEEAVDYFNDEIA